MARAPRAAVSKTSGQGVSRLSYQKSYALKGGSPGLKASFSKGDSDERSYAKKKAPRPEKAGGINVSYGDTYFPTDIKDIEAVGERQVPKTKVGSQRQGPKKWRK